MAELNLNQIAAKLNEAFTGDARQLIFWYDENGELITFMTLEELFERKRLFADLGIGGKEWTKTR